MSLAIKCAALQNLKVVSMFDIEWNLISILHIGSDASKVADDGNIEVI